METNFSDRSARLDKIAEHLPVIRRFPLLAEVKIKDSLFEKLAYFTKLYLASSLRAADVTEERELTEEALITRRDDFLRLPNLTPNGLVMPKRDNMLEFNLLHRSVSEIFSRLAIDSQIVSIRMPAMVRLVDGRRVEEKENRPFASTKLHSDVWNGDPAREILVLLPVLGDVRNTGIEFFEPDQAAMRDWIKDLPDYNAGAHLLSSARRYDIEWRAGHIYFVDQLVLHRTMKTGGGIRVCVDYHFVPKEEVPSDHKPEEEKGERVGMRNYAELPQWYALGNSLLFTPEETFEETKKRFAGGIEQVNYRPGFSMINLER